MHVISIHPLRLANTPCKVQRLNNSCRRVSSLSHCDLSSFQLWEHSVRRNLTKNDKQLSPSTLFAPSLKDTRLSVLYMLFLWDAFVCVYVCVTCFSWVGHRSWPTPCDVYVEDVHWCHGEITVAQFTGPTHSKEIILISQSACFGFSSLPQIINTWWRFGRQWDPDACCPSLRGSVWTELRFVPPAEGN